MNLDQIYAWAFDMTRRRRRKIRTLRRASDDGRTDASPGPAGGGGGPGQSQSDARGSGAAAPVATSRFYKPLVPNSREALTPVPDRRDRVLAIVQSARRPGGVTDAPPGYIDPSLMPPLDHNETPAIVPDDKGIQPGGGGSALRAPQNDINQDSFIRTELKTKRWAGTGFDAVGLSPFWSLNYGTFVGDGAGNLNCTVAGAGNPAASVVQAIDYARFTRMRATATVSAGSVGAGTIAWGNYSGGNFSGYSVRATIGGNAQISRWDAGIETALGSGGAFAAGNNFSIQRKANNVYALINGSLVKSAVDPTYTSGSAFLGASAVTMTFTSWAIDGWNRF